MYQPGHGTYVDVGSVAVPWEGTSRPTHFRGVATIVLKLFQIIPAQRAYFGRKDYQQSLVVRKLASDLNLPIQIRVCPIVREADGLAMSSRNAYLDAEQRQRATALYRSLQLAEQMHGQGVTDVAEIKQAMQQLLSQENLEVEYIAFLKDGSVDEVTQLTEPTVVALAARVGKTRLIDNYQIG